MNLHVVLLQFIAAGELMSQVRICKKKSCVAVRIFAFCGVSQCEFLCVAVCCSAIFCVVVLQCVAVGSSFRNQEFEKNLAVHCVADESRCVALCCTANFGVFVLSCVADECVADDFWRIRTNDLSSQVISTNSPEIAKKSRH